MTNLSAKRRRGLGRLQVCGRKRVPYPAIGMTILMLELANDCPPFVKIVTKPGYKTYYTLRDLDTIELEDAFKSADRRLDHLLHGRRVGEQAGEAGY